MKIEDINKGFEALSDVVKPWQIVSTEVGKKSKIVDIYIEYEKEAQFPCPVCGIMSKVHDSREHRIRYLDSFKYRS